MFAYIAAAFLPGQELLKYTASFLSINKASLLASHPSL
jgi:hypothetical protein